MITLKSASKVIDLFTINIPFQHIVLGLGQATFEASSAKTKD